MNKVIKIFNRLVILILIMLFILFGSAITLIKKPDLGIRLYNNFFSENIFLEFSNLVNNGTFISPSYEVNEFKVIINEKDYLTLSNLEFGINLIKSLSSRTLIITEFALSDVKISDADLDSRNNTNISNEASFIIDGRNLNVLGFSSKTFEIKATPSLVSAVFYGGAISDLSFLSLKINSRDNYQTWSYKSEHNFGNDELAQLKIINLEDYNEVDYTTYVTAKGKLNSQFQNISSSYFVKISDSRFVLNSGFSVKDLSGDLHITNGDVVGKFSAYALDQELDGGLNYDKEGLSLYTEMTFDMAEVINDSAYFSIQGKEIFSSIIKIDRDGKSSINLKSNMTNTSIKSLIDELNKPLQLNLDTEININDLSKPIYSVKNSLFKVIYDPSKNSGFFATGEKYLNKDIPISNSFNIFLDISDFKYSDIEFSTSEGDSNIKLLEIMVDEFNFYDSILKNQFFEINFLNNETRVEISGDDLNGIITSDNTGFTRIDIENSTINNLKLINADESNSDSIINLRLIGSNIEVNEYIFESLDLYFLRNKNITTIDNINIKSDRVNVSSYENNSKAYISHNKISDLYKIKGKFDIYNDGKFFKNLIPYDFSYLNTDLNIQWNSRIDLTNLEGEIDFLLKDLSVKNEISNSGFLRTLKLFNLDSLVNNIEDINRNESLNIKRAEGNMIIGKNRALIQDPLVFSTNEAEMKWSGEILKNNKGNLNNLNLDLSLRLKVSENLPWYAALIGGIPAVFGSLVIEDIFDENIKKASSLEFKVKGTIDEPIIERLDQE